MNNEKKWMILGMCATIFCLAVSVVCAALRKFDIVSSIMFAIVVAFSITISVFLCIDVFKKNKDIEVENTTEEVASENEQTQTEPTEENQNQD